MIEITISEDGFILLCMFAIILIATIVGLIKKTPNKKTFSKNNKKSKSTAIVLKFKDEDEDEDEDENPEETPDLDNDTDNDSDDD